ncbi:MULTISPECIES: hypothetical protein [unclassified Bradyrhizobium]|uniref:hypothetical protein n=1 Tax=unclassified Bradyrhizobium TaxID=2631580 RepID=UPI001BAA821A|nr:MULTISPECIES: hypothetical protein [unclassified Bradyrhizobium]WLA52388.1 hypothetical protein QIH80_21210 [Bradyrhizobium elkanii]MBR1206948.1 hypothetical protein [Bradyrhizobium sp. AUGA SZCCT0124]MBR1313487.1 hypothetical protein [Bradyrhizobium sp. AUGA SZCCT0051]MBR1343416.1 hypothetical protein [Bradyrhizobium sp. AUGA SZCCT0105]MBR1357164.1 hypothetical protein [Bradyrhizobium sp. AUGA SZCCT0045]
MPNLIYATGTVAIGAGAVSVAGAGGPLWASNVQQFDKLIVDGFAGVDILGVTDDTHLVIAKWPFAAVPAGTVYQILQTSPLRFNGAQNSAEVIRLTGALETDGFFVFVRSDRTEPDPSKGDEGQYARQPATGKEWLKTGGVWVYQGVNKALGQPAPYDPAHTYALNDVTTLNGSSFVWSNTTPGSGHAPPDATYWQVLAAKGDTGATGPVPWQQTVSWATGQNYVAAAPASIVVYTLNKNIYQCIVPHLSTTFEADRAAGKWLLIAQGLTEGTSTSSQSIGIGSVLFQTQIDLSYLNGARLRAASSGSIGNWVEGQCTYNPANGQLILFRDKSSGAGTYTDWAFSRVGQPGAGDVSSTNCLSEYAGNTALARINLGIPGVLSGYLSGLKITSPGGVSTFSVSAGVACDRSAGDMIVLSAALTKSSSAWAAGNNNGCLDTGALANGFYHVFVIKNPTTSVVDVLMSKSATAPTMPAGYTLFRRIGVVWFNSGVNFSALLQRGREFFWPGSALDLSTTIGTTLQTFALASCPAGVRVQALLNIIAWNATQNTTWWTHETGLTDNAPSYSVGANGLEASTATSGNASDLRVWTDTSAQVCARSSAAGTSYRCFTRGWFDPLE